jgi:transposase
VSQPTKVQPSARATRRRFGVDEKLRILSDYEAATTPEARGAVLRREGIYSSHIALWRQKRDSGGKAALDRKRGPKPNPDARELEKLRRQNQRLVARNQQLEKIVEIQGKMQALLHELGSKETAPPPESSREKR